jgi:GNAT superfamily N-acetyltransferase
MVVDADTAAAAVIEVFQRLATVADRGWSQRIAGAFAWVTGVNLPTLNGVIVDCPGTVEVPAVASLLDEVSATGLSHCLQVRPDAIPELVRLAENRGLVRDEAVPLMATDNSTQMATGPFVEGLDIYAIEPGEMDLLAGVAANGFEAPPDAFHDLMAKAFQLDGMRGYLGYLGGEPVGTAMGLTVADFVAIFTVSTGPAWRGRGVGAALTARAVFDGYTAGSTWSWLQSSSMGHNLYRSLGFVDLEEWACWLACS